MPDTPHPTRLRLGAGRNRREMPFDLGPDDIDVAALARELDLLSLRKLRFRGILRPRDASDWDLEAALGATVVQACSVSLDPVTTRIDETVTRRYMADMATMDLPPEQEMPEDETEEPLPASVDLAAILTEALALAVPAFPRAEGVEAVDLSAAAPGAEPIRDEDTKPFAGLRDALKGGM